MSHSSQHDRVQVRVRPVSLPHGPRETMRALRAHGRYALLESALPMARQAQWSYIAGPARATLATDALTTRLERDGIPGLAWGDPFDALAAVTRCDPHDITFDGERPAGMDFVGGWVGVLGYDLARDIERLPATARRDPDLPRICWIAVDQVLAFHHPTGQWWHATACGPTDRWPWTQAGRPQTWQTTLDRAAGPVPEPGRWRAAARTRLTSQSEFEHGVAGIRDRIADGEVFQVNLTRREDTAFTGDAWALYEDLVAAHPAPFAAYIEGPGFAIASCSPERFLRRRDDEVEARPIKGTVARGRDSAEDEIRRAWLATSEKDRAENLMIVDLMRNDLGRVAATGTVRVPELFALEPYASVWQMVSTVTARLRPGTDNAALLRACWPPGSMTGAPKVKAMQIIEALEPVRRGFYAGSIGYMDVSGNMDLSVVIRSAVVADGRVMVQFGGGIVADSDPRSEWQETVAKGVRLTQVLDRHGNAVSEFSTLASR